MCPICEHHLSHELGEGEGGKSLYNRDVEVFTLVETYPAFASCGFHSLGKETTLRQCQNRPWGGLIKSTC